MKKNTTMKSWNYSVIRTIVVGIVLCQTTFVTCQSSRAETFQTILGKPPDLQNRILPQQTLPKTNNVNKVTVGNNYNPFKPMVFRCRDMVPRFSARKNISPQAELGPYTITVTPTEAIPGDIIQVLLSAKPGHVIKGFMVQGYELSADDSTGVSPLGQFIQTPYTNLQSCSAKNDTCVSVIAGGENTVNTVQVLWQVPQHTFSKHFFFRATLVEDLKTYWTNVTSSVITSAALDHSNTNIGDNTKPTGKTEGASDLEKAVSETFESIDGPLESVNEVLLHQGVQSVQKVGGSSSGDSVENIVIKPSYVEDELEINVTKAVDHGPKYVYETMNRFPRNFEPPETSEFIGSLLGGGGGNSGGGGIGQMFQMYNQFQNMKKLFGGGQQQAGPPSGLSLLGSLMGGGSAPGGQTGGNAGGLGMLTSLLGGGGAGNSGGPAGGLFGNIAPPPQGAPVNPPRNDEPSLADLLGVDPSTVEESAPAAIPGANNPLSGLLAGTSAATAAGTGGSRFGSMIKFAPIALGVGSMLFKGKKQQQMPQGWPPQGQQGFGGGQQQMPPPGFNGMGPPGGQGGWGQQPQGMPQGMQGGGWGMPTPAPFGGMSAGGSQNDALLQQLKQTQSQLDSLTQKMNSGTFGQPAPTQASFTNGAHSETYDLLLRELIKQNQLLMEQNLQFKNSFLTMAPQSASFETRNGGFTSNLSPPNNNMFGTSSGSSSLFNNAPPTSVNSNFMSNPQPPPSNQGNFGQFGGGSSGFPSNNAFGGQSAQHSAGSSVNSFLGGNTGGGNTPTAGGSALGNLFGGGAAPQTGHSSAPSGGLGGLLGGGGGGSGGGGGLAGLLGGGGGGGGGGGLAGLLGGGGGGGGGNPLAGLLGGGGGGMSQLVGNVDKNALEGALGGAEGQELMSSINGLMSGPQGANLMNAMEGMMSGNMNINDMQSLMSGMDPTELMSMANQAQDVLAKSGIDPNQLMGSLLG